MITYEGRQLERAIAAARATCGRAAAARLDEAMDAARRLDAFAVDASVAVDAARFDEEKAYETGRAAGFREGFRAGVDITRRLLS